MDIFSTFTNQHEQSINIVNPEPDSLLEKLLEEEALLEKIMKQETIKGDLTIDDLDYSFKIYPSIQLNPPPVGLSIEDEISVLDQYLHKSSITGATGPTGAPEGPLGLTHSGMLGANGPAEPITSGKPAYGILKEFLDKMIKDMSDSEPQPLQFENNIVEGPDGEKYYVDGTGMFINVKDVDNSFILNPETSLEYEIHYIKAEENLSKLNKVELRWNEDQTTVLADIYLIEGVQVDSIDKKYLFEHFTLLGANELDARSAVKVTGDKTNVPTCMYFSEKQSLSEKYNLEPSEFYQFDRPSKTVSCCSHPQLQDSSAGAIAPCISRSAQYYCPQYSPESWSTEYITKNQEVQVFINKRRYGLGSPAWIAVNAENDEVIIDRNEEAKEKEFELLVSELVDAMGFETPVKFIPTKSLPLEEVYTHYVSNA